MDQPENKPENKRVSKLTPKMIEKQWKPGQTGNPGGRPAKKPITEMYERILSDPKAVAQIEKALKSALSKGQMAMVLQLREMTDRIEGKVTQPITADVTVNLSEAIHAARKRVGK